MLTCFQILLGEGVLLQVQTESFRKPHRIIDIKLLGRQILVFENETHEFVILIEEHIERMLSVMVMRFYILNDSDFGLTVLCWVLLDRWMISVTHRSLVFLFRCSLKRGSVWVMPSFCWSIIRLVRIGVLVKHQLLELRDVGAGWSGVHLIHLEATVGIAVVHAPFLAMCHEIWIRAAPHAILPYCTVLVFFLFAAFRLLQVVTCPLPCLEELLV